MTADRHLAKVIIPIYTAQLTRYEHISLTQVCRVLSAYPLVVVKPKGLEIDNLLQELPALTTESFDADYFRSVSSYNRLMLSTEFYQRFADTQYILIYQLDAYIFRDELAEWCHRDYDYIGAPWLVRPMYRFPLFVFTSWLKRQYCTLLGMPNSQVTHFKVGNGGLSLRKVSSHLRCTAELQPVIRTYLSYKKNHIFNEDVFFSVEVNRHGMGFRYPDYHEALLFSFDKYPALCYRLTGGRLPFGCHGWYKRKMKQFWFPVILPAHE
ncbi:MAG: hypothetical protein LBN06_04535 [Prevotellaceae bacterium]|nr:hypothetical protein [Prevotellaceae bacterium]